MVRKLAPQVPQAVARLLRAQTIPEPVWFRPVLNNPPTPLPARQLANRRSKQDLPSSNAHLGSDDHSRTRKLKDAKTPKLRIQPIVYEQRDQIRKRFLEDFPFEALRPVSLVEGREVAADNKASGAAWTELKQRGDNPTVEDTIEYVINLHEHHGLSLASAYRKATSDFVNLRAINEMAQYAAEQEALYYGTTWQRSAFDRFFALEEKALNSLSRTPAAQSNTPTSTTRPYRPTFAPTAHKRRQWVPQVSSERTAAKNGKEFTGGLAYVTAWADVERAEKAARNTSAVGEAEFNATQRSESGSVVPEPVGAEVQQEVPVSAQ